MSLHKKNQIHDSTLYPDILKTQDTGDGLYFFIAFTNAVLDSEFLLTDHEIMWSLLTFCKFQSIRKLFIESSSFYLGLHAKFQLGS